VGTLTHLVVIIIIVIIIIFIISSIITVLSGSDQLRAGLRCPPHQPEARFAPRFRHHSRRRRQAKA
jgi:hypothetical protein